MKYAKELDKVVNCSSFIDRVFIISYRKWKKVKNLKTHWKTWLFIDILLTPKHLLDTNLKTLYKICKRFEKRKLCDDSSTFYTRVSKIFSEKAASTSLF